MKRTHRLLEAGAVERARRLDAGAVYWTTSNDEKTRQRRVGELPTVAGAICEVQLVPTLRGCAE